MTTPASAAGDTDNDSSGRPAYVAPVGMVETVLSGILADVLQVADVGRNDCPRGLIGQNVEHLHDVNARIRQSLGVTVPESLLLADDSTLSDVARRIVARRMRALAPITPVSRLAPVVASFEQRRLWMLSQIGASEAYNVQLAFRLSGTLNEVALRTALDRLVDRHESLRTRFRTADGDLFQFIDAPGAGFALRSCDISADAQSDDPIAQLLAQDARAPFDLEHGPSCRACLARVSEGVHVLVITLHHINIDGWSVDVLLRDLALLYEAISCGRECTARKHGIGYADYAAWQRRWHSSDALREEQVFWRDALKHAPVLLDLPTDRTRPARQDFSGADMLLELNATQVVELRALGRRYGMTLFMTVLAGWAAVLSRLSGQQDLVIGTPTANRTRTDIDAIVGMFVNTLALRIATEEESTVEDLLLRTRATVLDAQQHQDLPFEQVVELLKPPRSLAHTPLFQVMLVWQGEEPTLAGLPGLHAETLASATPMAKFDLTLELTEVGDRVVGRLNYATALFDQQTARRHADYLHRVLAQMARDPGQRLADLELQSAQERDSLLAQWSRTQASFTSRYCIHELFEEQAAAHPDSVALVHEGHSLRYGELNAEANRLAHALRALGAGPECRVAICAERCVQMVVAILAVLKSGAAYVPIDPAYPNGRIAHMLKDSAPVVALGQGAGTSMLAAAIKDQHNRMAFLDLEADAGRWAELPDHNPNAPAAKFDSSSLAYVIYTSGSTGTPKGVMVEHRNVVRLFDATRDLFVFGSQDVWTLFHSFAFDFSVWELWGALLHGGRVVLVPHAVSRSPEDFYALVCDEGVTVLNQTPSAFKQFITAQASAPLRAHSLRFVIFGGEALEPSCLRPWVQRNGMQRVQLVNMYGITETTVHVTFHFVTSQQIELGSSSVIGRPLADLKILLLDSRRRPVPVGVVGELYVGGGGVARGYQNLPQLTAERFVSDPLTRERLYRSGDLGRWRADGTLEYLGRNDTQVKIRGFRIELGEIEARLQQQPGIGEVAVVARADSSGDKRLVAYYTALRGQSPDLNEIRASLARSLPDYMVPAAYVCLEALPLTTNGKLDATALPAPKSEDFGLRTYEPPVGPVEAAIAAVWADVLEIGRVGRGDNFFELGGHSLLAVRLLERLRQDGLRLDVRTLFSTPTVSAVAASVVHEAGTEECPAVSISPNAELITPDQLPLVQMTPGEIDRVVASVFGGVRNIQDIYPLVPLQEGILFHHLMAEEGDPYLLWTLVGFADLNRLDAFVGALNAVIARHDILRTAIVWEGLSKPVQVVWRAAPVRLEKIELPTGTDAIAELRDRLHPSRHRLDLQQAPLMRLVATWDEARSQWIAAWLLHHIVDDNTSLKLLQMEIDAHLAGLHAQLPSPLPFRSFVARTQRATSSESLEDFFGPLLGDIEVPTAPFGLMDVHGDGSAIAESNLTLEADLCNRIRAQARRLKVSAATLMHVAWAQVLARTAGTTDPVFGTVLFGRMQGGLGSDRILGPFINTLPVRLRLDAVGVETCVLQTHQLLARLLQHEHAQLASAQAFSRLPPNTPLFTSVFNFRHNTDVPTATGASAREGIHYLAREERSNYPVTMSIDDLGDAFRLRAQTVAQIDPRQLCGLVATAIDTLVHALQQAPQTPALATEVLPEEQRRRLIVDLAAPCTAAVRASCVQEIFEERVREAPHAVALVGEGGELTYAQLNSRANQLAHRLLAAGVRTEDRVALHAQRGIDLIVALLGILKAGAAYVPLDPTYPRERLAYLISDSEPVLLLTQTALRDALPDLALPVIELDAAEEEPWFAGQSVHNPDHVKLGVTPGSLAYVIFTSGSTGQPKGVMVEHRGLCNLVDAQSVFDVGHESRVLLFASFAFDASVFEILMALTRGARLVVVSREELTPGDALVETLLRQGITHLTITPSALAACGDAPEVRLRTLVVAGEAINSAIAQRWASRCRLFNAYGPTECTVWATTHEIRANANGAVPIGRPIPNTRVFVLDEQLRPVPEGAIGEICIGGAGVARGYQGLAALTSKRFVSDPFSRDTTARLYRTGDLGRWRRDGELEFLGRNDDQVKVRGFRIEPGEIEAHLSLCANVQEAAVVVREDVPGERRLVAYVVANDGRELRPSELRHALSQTLPEHLLPSAFVVLATLPMTPNGKLDRKSLPTPEHAGASDRPVEAPIGLVEQALAEIWAEVLQVSRVGRHDNFFELGGHSLLATVLIGKLHQNFENRISLRALFQYPTLSELATLLGPPGSGSGQERISAGSRDGRLAVSFAQQRMWFLTRFEPNTATYHVPLVLRFRGPLNRDALVRSVERLVARHEALRSRIVETDAGLEQLIDAHGTFEVALATAANSQELLSSCVAELCRPFDLAASLPLRARLIRLDDQDNILQLTLHHIVSDGWSVSILVRELFQHYVAFANGGEDPLPILSVQYQDFVQWQNAWLDSERLAADLAYWRQQLAGLDPLLNLPTDRPRPAIRTSCGKRHRFSVTAAVTRSLVTMARQHGCTTYMILLAAYYVVLNRYSSQEDIAIGTPIANRSQPQTQALVGLFVNTLVLRARVTPAASFADLLAKVRETVLNAYAHQDIPFEFLVQELRPVRSTSHAPFFQNMFVLQNLPPYGPNPPGLHVETLDVDSGTAKFDLSLFLRESVEGLHGTVEFNADLFDISTIERFAGHYTNILSAIAKDPHQCIYAIPLLGEDERNTLLREWNDTDAPYDRSACIHELFERRAALQPDAVAIRDSRRETTYAQLAVAAGRLAGKLAAEGVVRGTRVGVCLDRNVELVVALLGILKAGGVYVPIDPTYPTARIDWIVQDSGMHAVVVQAHLLPCMAQVGRRIVADSDWLDELLAATSTSVAVPNLREIGLDSEDVAYVIYTSGSTGRPKGVVVQHRPVINVIEWVNKTFDVGPSDTLLCVSSVSFDLSVYDIFGVLAAGGRVHIADDELLREPQQLAEVLATESITIWDSAPTRLQQLVPFFTPRHAESFGNTLRLVMLSGDWIPVALPDIVRSTFRKAQVVSLGGATEATIWSNFYPIATVPDTWVSIPYGKPIQNARYYVLDGHGQPCPIGVAGHLFISGECLALGYSDESATRRQFVACPFDGTMRMYATGDLARWMADGNLQFLGRDDNQVKIRGFRVELGEIERSLLGYPDVVAAAVLAQPDGRGQKLICAYVVSGAGVSAEALRSYLAEYLPEYMIPSFIVFLDALPMSANGKLDRGALPALELLRKSPIREAAPDTPLEKELAALIGEVLGVDEVGLSSSFFEIGGTSLSLALLNSKLNLRFDKRMTMVQLFQNPTVAGIAAFLSEAGDPRAPARLVGDEDCDSEHETLRRSLGMFSE